MKETMNGEMKTKTSSHDAVQPQGSGGGHTRAKPERRPKGVSRVQHLVAFEMLRFT